MNNKRMDLKDWISLILLSILWGGSFFFVEVALQSFPPFTLVFIRILMASLLLLIIVFLKKESLALGKKVWLFFLLMGLLNNALPFSLLVWGQKSLTGGLASIFIAITPFFTILAAHIFTHDEKITPKKLIGVILGFTGVFILTGFQVGGLKSDLLLGELAVLSATISYALAGIWGRRFRKMGIKPLVAATGQLSCATLLLLPVSLIFDKPWTLSLPTSNSWAAVIAMAIFSTALAYILYFKILGSAGATNVLLVTFLVPISASFLGFTLLNEAVSINQIMGIVIIGIGMVFIDGRLIDLSKMTKRKNK